jgi:cell wall-associated NlpC family hydrolase
MNIKKYMGIPYIPGGSTFTGCDCMGLVRLFYFNELGIALQGEFNPSLWADGWLQVEKPVVHDVVLMKLFGQPIHCGLVTGHGEMLHTTVGEGSHLGRYDGLRWASRIVGFTRHKDLV